MPKRYSEEAQTGEAAIALIDRAVTAMGFVWHPRRIDHGIDGEIELVDPATRRPLNRGVLVQSKARRSFAGEDDDGFHYLCEEAELEYWQEAKSPVIVVGSHPERDEAWWAAVTPGLTMQSRRLHFDKRDRFDLSAASRLLDLAVPPDEPLYVRSATRRESLTSNLLAVDHLPPTIWAGPAIVGDNREANQLLRDQKVFAKDWTVHDRTLFCFREPDEGLRRLIDGVAEAIDASEWADAKSPDTVRLFVRLLNQTLADTHHRELRRHPKRHYLYFRATTDLAPRVISTGRSTRGRTVFQQYTNPRNADAAAYYRHHAVDAQFVRLDGAWYLELNPTYHFTLDGHRDLPWGADLVAGMKRRERNSAVSALVRMWATHLSRGNDLFVARDDAPIRFGNLVAFDVEDGLDESAWNGTEPPPTDDTDPAAPTLFEAS